MEVQLNQYEIAVLYDPDLEVDLDKATSRVEKIFKDNGAKLINVDNWGKRKLAYPIQHHESAIYVFYQVELAADAIKKLDSIFNITNEVIRFLIIKPDFKAMAKAEAARAEKAAKAASRGEALEETAETDDEAE